MASGASDQRPQPLHAADAPQPAAGSNPVLRLDNTKAGMGGVDKARVEAVINDLSRGTPFFVNEQRKAQQRQRRIDAMLAKCREYDDEAKFPEVDRRRIARDVAALEKSLECRQVLGVFVHVDMDMFFAAVEEKLNPALRDVPMGVGGMGMLSTTNYRAREFGVRAGMPGYIGKKLCPQLVFAFSGFDVYRRESALVRGVVERFDPDFSSGGLDEFTLNIAPYLEARRCAEAAYGGGDGADPSDAQRLWADAASVAAEIRQQIFDATQLTASCGIAPTPCLAKIVSNTNKPNGQFVLACTTWDDVLAFVRALPVRQVPGIGKALEDVLAALGVRTVDDLYQQRHRLSHAITPKTFHFLLEVATGVMGAFGGFGVPAVSAAAGAEQHLDDNATPAADRDGGGDAGSYRRKSIGQERTFRPFLSEGAMRELAERNLASVHDTLVEEGLVARQVGLKLKHRNFEVRQSSFTLPMHTDDIEELRKALDALLEPHLPQFSTFRLLGVRVTDLEVKVDAEGDGNGAAAAAPMSLQQQHQHHGTGRQLQPTLPQLLEAMRGLPQNRERADVVVVSSDDDDDEPELLTSRSVPVSSPSVALSVNNVDGDVDEDVIVVVGARSSRRLRGTSTSAPAPAESDVTELSP